jgi:hypothetical protein
MNVGFLSEAGAPYLNTLLGLGATIMEWVAPLIKAREIQI